MSTQSENSYRTIIRRLSTFGGVQVFNVLISLLRGKFVAFFLGPEGMGITSLFTISTTTIQQFSGLGLGNAIVKESSSAKDNAAQLAAITRVATRLIWLTAILGALICAVGAPLWSRLAFGDSSQTVSFVVLGGFVALSMAGMGYLNILQGIGEVKRLSRASVVGGLSGLCFGVPLYWLYGADGIVPAMLLLSVCTFAFYFISFRRSRVPQPAVPLERQEATQLVRRLISLGVVLLAGALAGTLTQYVITIYIRWAGGETQVGLFQSANSITSQYIGMIFSVLALDYFPRLSASSSDRHALSMVVGRQIEVGMLTVTPLIMLLMASTPIAIELLLTGEFHSIKTLVRWLGYGSFLMTVSYPMGYVFVARGERRIYLWMECLLLNLTWIICSVGGYMLFGLNGLGISLVVRTLIDIAVYYSVCHSRYGLSFTPEARREMAVAATLCTACFAVSFFSGWWVYVLMALLTVVSLSRSFVLLHNRFRSRH